MSIYMALHIGPFNYVYVENHSHFTLIQYYFKYINKYLTKSKIYPRLSAISYEVE